VVVLALLIKDLITASGFTLPRTMTAVMLMLILMLDFPVFKLSEETLVLSASKVPLTLKVPVPRPLSASSTLAVALALVLN
jgi:hypothetical protein